MNMHECHTGGPATPTPGGPCGPWGPASPIEPWNLGREFIIIIFNFSNFFFLKKALNLKVPSVLGGPQVQSILPLQEAPEQPFTD